ncbi:hypothetical protein GCM10020295_56770 [Streptomyces cinereospinus]
MTHSLALRTAEAVADLLADPATAPIGPDDASLHRQHLAYGPTGIALLHIERAAAGLGPWKRAHDWFAAAARQPFTSGPDSHPFYGAPALAHAVACAADHLPGAYERARDSLNQRMSADVRRRLEAAHRRIDAGRLPELAEFDAIRGLVGYGVYFLRRDTTGADVRAILSYCVRLTEPVTYDGGAWPGWWTPSGPSGRPDERFPGGHANNGMAHGIGGVLALLALAARRGVTVDCQREAAYTILAWLDRWGRRPAGARRGPTGLRETSCTPAAPIRLRHADRHGATERPVWPAPGSLPPSPSATSNASSTRRTRLCPPSRIASSSR